MNTPKHILIIADGFGAPSYNPRLRALCDYLHAQNYALTVVVEHIADLPFEHAYPIHELQLYSGSKLDWALKNVWSLLTDWKNRRFSALVEQHYSNRSFDLVFCTTFHTCPLRAAIDFGKRHHIPVLTDIRDLTEQAPGNQINYLAHQNRLLQVFVQPYQRINIRRRDRQLRQANCVTTVSPWHVGFLKHINSNTHLIYNGFDANRYTPASEPCKEFIISYCGKFFGEPLHNAHLLFEALAEMPELKYKLIVHTNLEGKRLLKQLAKHYQVPMQTGDYIPQAEVLRLYRQSSILLVLTNKASAQNVHGMMTTKFFEALGVEKPVLCVRSDEECLAQVIHETNAGIAATNKDEVKIFIRSKYQEWQTNGFTRQHVHHKELFTRQYQSRQFEELLNNLIIGPMVNVIVPAYNAANYIAECLCSIKNQTYGNWQCIVVDDGSTDNTATIVQAFVDADSRFTLLRHQTNRGQSAARNTALEQANGDYICFVDADDWLDSDFLTNHKSEILNHKFEIVQSGYRRIMDDGTVTEVKMPRHPYQFVSPCMRLYRREILNDLRFQDQMIYEDVLFSLGLWAKHPQCQIIPYIGYNYRLNPASTTARVNKAAQQRLYTAIRGTKAPFLLKIYTLIRLKLHFRK